MFTSNSRLIFYNYSYNFLSFVIVRSLLVNYFYFNLTYMMSREKQISLKKNKKYVFLSFLSADHFFGNLKQYSLKIELSVDYLI